MAGSPRPASPRRLPGILARAATGLAVSGALLALLEAGLRVAGVQAPEPLFRQVQGPDGQEWTLVNEQVGANWFRTPEWEDLVKQPRPGFFLAQKPPDVVRVFLLGESAAYGTPLDDNATWARQLEYLLNRSQVDPNRRVEVINLAVRAVSLAVYLDVLDPIRAASPDLVVLYGGHNEFYGMRPAPFPRSTRTWRLAESLLTRPVEEDGETRLGIRANWQVLPGDPLSDQVPRRFSQVLDDLVEGLEGIPVLAYVPWGNERHLSPLCSVDDTPRFHALLTVGATNPSKAQGNLCKEVEAGLASNPAHAGLWFLAGQCATNDGDPVAARAHFQKAQELDCVPVRSRHDVREVLRGLPQRHPEATVVVADPEAPLRAASEGQVLGHEVLYDHVHLSLLGSYLVARQGVQALAEAAVPGLALSASAIPSEEETRAGLAILPMDEYRYLDRTVRFYDASSVRDAASKGHSVEWMRARMKDIWPTLSPGERATLLDQSPEAHIFLGRSFQRGGDLDGALSEARIAVQVNPASSRARRFLSEILVEKGDLAGGTEQMGWAGLLDGAYPETNKRR